MPFTPLDNRFALLVINFQNGIVADMAQPEANQAISNASLLVQACRSFQKPVIFVSTNPFLGNLVTTNCDEPLFPPSTDLQKKEVEMRAAGWFNPVASLQPLEGETQIIKSVWNAFYETKLNDTLLDQNISQILICGLTTSSDIEMTAACALDLGYKIAIPLDALGDSELILENQVKVKKLTKIGQTGTTQQLTSLIR